MDLTPMHKRVIALDVHQAKITACAVVEHDDGRVEVTKRDFGAFKRDRRALAQWALEMAPEVVVMESTGVYWKSPFAALEAVGLIAWVVNARHVKAVPGRKTDMADAQQTRTRQRGQPLRVSHVGLATGHGFDVSGIDHPRDDAHGFKCRKRALPVHPGALHDHHLRPHFQRPLRQGAAITLERTELAFVRFDAAILLLDEGAGGDFGLVYVQRNHALVHRGQLHGHGSYNFHHNCKGVWATKAGATDQWPGGPSPSALFNVGCQAHPNPGGSGCVPAGNPGYEWSAAGQVGDRGRVPSKN